ncbi:HNH endonuclease [Pectobacterium carotovorum]|uniref:HNH endonuclease n=1 Tax=Pectobacterium carotovorum TaxID=554 RepID=UPI0029D9EA82|nr:HNH endonuclease [Pectobacterium carotovorum]MDX6914400.1 HNH endonuclease [Pectobacterium carotovorum]
MPVSFEELKIGESYERPYLADMWGYKGFQAISKGVVTPSEGNCIILFVTKEKQATLTQYNDFLDEGLLHWEGEKKHSSDNRIINAKSMNDRIYLFYRERHHSPFIYYGEISLKKYNLRKMEPSYFIFNVGEKQQHSDLLDEIKSHQNEYNLLEQTEKDSIVKSRIGQGLFRDGVVKLWGYCAVTDLSNLSLLRASHIKPWRDSSNQERLDPMNGLLLQPTLDHLFDLGLITFSETGVVMLSSVLSQDDIQKLELRDNLKLRKLPAKLMSYMEYHRRHVFNG